MLCGCLPKSPFDVFFSLAESEIKSIKDWKGKRIGAAQSAVPQIKAILDYNGLKFEDITFVQAQIPGLLQDQVDVVGAWPTNLGQIKPVTDHPAGYNSQSIWDNGLQFQSNYYVAHQDTLENYPEMLAAFLEAADAGWAYAADNQAEAVDLVLMVSPALDRGLASGSLAMVIRDYIYTDETLAHGFGYIAADRWDRTLNTYKGIGEIEPSVSVADVFDDRILKAATRTMR